MVKKAIRDALAAGNVEALAVLVTELIEERESTTDPLDRLAVTRVLLMAMDSHERALFRRRRQAQADGPEKAPVSAVDELLARRAARHGNTA